MGEETEVKREPSAGEHQFAEAEAAWGYADAGDAAANHRALYRMCQALEYQIEDLRSVLNALQPCPEFPALTTLEAVRTEPTMRVRLQHSHTLKEGWRLSESTVEWSGAGTPDWEAIAGQLRAAHVYGRIEAEDRNNPIHAAGEGGAE